MNSNLNTIHYTLYTSILLLLLVGGKVLGQYPDSIRPIPIEKDWQEKILAKPNKSVLDYYLLLPDYLFRCEMSFTNDEQSRLNDIDYKNVRAGYLKASPENNIPMTVVLFKDRVNGVDIIGVTRSGFMGSQCGDLIFLTISQSDNTWRSADDYLPSDNEFESLEEELEIMCQREVFPWFELPEEGRTIVIRDEVDMDQVLFHLDWIDGKFKIRR